MNGVCLKLAPPIISDDGDTHKQLTLNLIEKTFPGAMLETCDVPVSVTYM